MNSILVTGGAGFIGSNFVRYLLKKYKNYRVVVLDALTYAGNRANLDDLVDENRFFFLQGDIRDREMVDRVMGNVDAVVNFAAETHVDRSILSAGDFIDTDVKGTFTLLESARTHGIERFLQISTDEVYGSIESGSFTEASTLAPNSPYAASKAGGDMLVRSYFVTYGLPVLITRSSNNFGPYQFPEKLIPLFVTNAIDDKPLPLYGDGLNVRDWLFVTDNCEAIDLVLHKGEIGQVYNIGGDNEHTNLEITHMILDHLGKPRDLIQPVKDRLGHDRRYSVDSSRMKQLGWQPRTNFVEAMRQTIDWYVSNQNWWRAVKEKSAAFKAYYQQQYGEHA